MTPEVVYSSEDEDEDEEVPGIRQAKRERRRREDAQYLAMARELGY